MGTTAATFARRITTALVGSAVIAGAGIATAGVAFAAENGETAPFSITVLSTSGTVGVSSIDGAACEYSAADVATTMWYSAPEVYALDSIAGREWEMVSYEMVVHDSETSEIVWASGMSDPVKAMDDEPAAFAEPEPITLAGTGWYTISYRIQWLGGGEKVYAYTELTPNQYASYEPGAAEDDFTVETACG